jgi:hypothetical protein
MAADQAKRPVEKAPKLPPRAPPLRVKSIFMQKSKYRHLLDDPNVHRWFRKLLRRSPVSAGEHLRRLGWLCEHFATTPQELAEKSKRKAEDWTEDMISLLEDEGNGAATYPTCSRQRKVGSNTTINGSKSSIELPKAKLDSTPRRSLQLTTNSGESSTPRISGRKLP